MIAVTNLSKIFKSQGGDVAAVKDVSFTVNDGEFASIIGRSGSGTVGAAGAAVGVGAGVGAAWAEGAGAGACGLWPVILFQMDEKIPMGRVP